MATGLVATGLLAPGLLAAGLVLGAAAPADAQQAQGDPALGRQVWLSGAPCRNCHGWAANGVQDGPQDPVGANLRKTTLTPEDMVEAVKCGRPMSEMPYFFAAAWQGDAKNCYGMNRADVGAALPPRTDTTLTQRQIDGVVAFIFAQFVGKGDPTFEECTELLGAASTRCAAYPKRAN